MRPGPHQSDKTSSIPYPRILLGALVVVAFGSTLFGDFVYDDRFLIVENSYLRDVTAWTRFFTESSWAGSGGSANNYRPLPLLTFGLNYAIGGLRPFDFHLVNLLLHIANVLLLFTLARKLGLPQAAAWLGSAFFAVHPLQTEPVAEIVGRMDLLAGAGMLAALLCHLKGRTDTSTESVRKRWMVGAILSYALALWSKEHVILFPLVAVAVDIWLLRLRGFRAYAVYVGYAATAVAYLAVRFSVLPLVSIAPARAPDLSNPLASVEWPLRFVSGLWTTGLYLKHLLVPLNLSPDYCYSQILPLESLTSGRALLGLVTAALLGAAGVALGNRSRVALAGLTLSIAAFLPVSNLLFPIGTVMGDRLFYLPLAGVGILIAVLVERLRRSSRRVPLIGVSVIVAFSTVLSIRQSSVWRNDFTLDQHTVRAAPRCARGHNNLGYDWLERDELRKAEKEFLTAIDLYSPYPQAQAGLARVEFARQNWSLAARHATAALAAQPGYVAMLHLAANSWRMLGNQEEAEMLWLRALEEDAYDVQALSNLAIVNWARGESDRAIELWRRASEQPDAPAIILFNLAKAYDHSGSFPDAASTYREYLQRDGGAESSESARLARERLVALQNELPNPSE